MSELEIRKSTVSGFDGDFPDMLSQLIRDRRTTKVLAAGSDPVEFPHLESARLNDVVKKAIADAGYAPFHYDRKSGGLAEPWRFYIVWQDACRKLSRKIPAWFPDVKPGNKLPAMLGACGAMVLVNWLPQFESGVEKEKQIQINEEHLAATAAAIQNLLLKLTADNLNTYWSSGGFFRTRLMFEKLGIDQNEKLLGAIFIDYGASGSVEHIPGKNRDRRSDYREWTRELSLDSIK